MASTPLRVNNTVTFGNAKTDAALKDTVPRYYKSPSQLKKAIADKIEGTKENLKRLEIALDEIDKLPVQLGQAGWHPEYGYILVRDLFIGGVEKYAVSKELNNVFSAEIILANGDTATVRAIDLLPITSATQVLFNEGNNS